MKKYLLLFLLAYVNFAMYPQSGITANDYLGSRIATIKAQEIEFDDDGYMTSINDTVYDLGWKVDVVMGGNSLELKLSGLYAGYSIPLYIDNNQGGIILPGATALDYHGPTSSSYGRNRDEITSCIYVLTGEMLGGDDSEETIDLHGTCYPDGSIRFENYFVFCIEECVAHYRNNRLTTVDTTYLYSPLFSNLGIRVPNATHSFNCKSAFAPSVPVDWSSVEYDEEEFEMLRNQVSRGGICFPNGHGGLVPTPIDPRKPVALKGPSSFNPSSIADIGKIDFGDSSSGALNRYVNRTLQLSEVGDDGAHTLGHGGLVPTPPDPRKPKNLFDDPSDPATTGLPSPADLLGYGGGATRITSPVPSNESEVGEDNDRLGSILERDQDFYEKQVNVLDLGYKEVPVYIEQVDDTTVHVFNLFDKGYTANCMNIHADGSMTFPAQLVFYDSEQGVDNYNFSIEQDSLVAENAGTVTNDKITLADAIFPCSEGGMYKYYYEENELTLTNGEEFVLVDTTASVDDYLTLSQVIVSHGDKVVIPVSLTNVEAVKAFRVMLSLPQGFELEGPVRLSDRKDDHELSCNLLPDGTWVIEGTSGSDKVFDGHSGELFYITVRTPEGAAGDYKCYLRAAVLTTWDGQTVRCSNASGKLIVLPYLLGDMNNDGQLNVSDVTKLISKILGQD